MTDPSRFPRRTVLGNAVGVGGTVLTAGLVAGPEDARAGSGGEEPMLPELRIRKFVDRLTVPPTVRGQRGRHGPELTVRMRSTRARLHSQMPPSPLWTFEGRFPGPTIEVDRAQRLTVRWVNEIDTPMPVTAVEVPDEVPGRPPGHPPTIYPGRDGKEPLQSVAEALPWLAVHLHGGHVTGGNDGWMENGILPGATQLTEYANDQPATALWYHDHAMQMTRFSILSGLLGMYVIRDREEASLGLPGGRYEIPLILCDRNFEVCDDGRPNGVLLHKISVARTDPARIGVPYKGPYPSVNGVIWPYLEVEPRPYRFRLQNSSNARVYRLVLVDEENTVLSDAVRLIGTDGGLLGEPVPIREGHRLSASERVDIVVDFSDHAGRTLRFVNARPGTTPGDPDVENNIPDPDVIQFRVRTRCRRPGPTLPPRLSDSFRRLDHASLPSGHDHRLVVLTSPGPTTGDARLWEMAEVDPSEVTVPSDGVIQLRDEHGELRTYRRMSARYHDATNFVIGEGNWEHWRILNLGGPPHPVHLHLVRFQVLHRHYYDVSGWDVALGGTREPVSYMRDAELEPHEDGWKDVVRVAAGVESVGRGELVSIATRFGGGGATGRFVYHCHLLEHEHDMMRPFVVLPEETMALNPHTNPEFSGVSGG